MLDKAPVRILSTFEVCRRLQGDSRIKFGTIYHRLPKMMLMRVSSKIGNRSILWSDGGTKR